MQAHREMNNMNQSPEYQPDNLQILDSEFPPRGLSFQPSDLCQNRTPLVTDVTHLDTFQVQQAPLDPAERNRDIYIGRADSVIFCHTRDASTLRVFPKISAF